MPSSRYTWPRHHRKALIALFKRKFIVGVQQCVIFAEIVPLLSELTTFMDRKHLSKTKNIKIPMIWTLLDKEIRQVLQSMSVYVELMSES